MAPVGVALLGLGRAGRFHLESLRLSRAARLSCVFDTDRSRAEAVARDRGCAAADTAQAAIEADDVDAVVVATPTPSHCGYVLAALDAGRAVLSEKPLGSELADIDRCYERARARGRPLLVAFQRRFDPIFASTLAAARAGEAGTLQFIRSVSRDSPLPAIDYIRTSGGLFHDCVVHDFDLVCQAAGEPPVEICAYGTSFLPDYAAVGDIDNAAALLRFGSGLLASIDVNRNSVYGYDQRLEIFGDAGMLEADNRPQPGPRYSGRGGVRGPRIDESFPTRYLDAYRAEMECFLRCVVDREEPPVTCDEVRLNHRIADAAVESMRLRRPVEI